MSAPKPLRGEIWMIDLDPKKGREQRGVRPCLIVSTDALNRSDFGTVTCRIPFAIVACTFYGSTPGGSSSAR